MCDHVSDWWTTRVSDVTCGSNVECVLVHGSDKEGWQAKEKFTHTLVVDFLRPAATVFFFRRLVVSVTVSMTVVMSVVMIMVSLSVTFWRWRRICRWRSMPERQPRTCIVDQCKLWSTERTWSLCHRNKWRF